MQVCLPIYRYIHSCVCRVEGSSVNLKNQFAGYCIELDIRQDSVNEVKMMVAERFPGVLLRSYIIVLEMPCCTAVWYRGSFEV